MLLLACSDSDPAASMAEGGAGGAGTSGSRQQSGAGTQGRAGAGGAGSGSRSGLGGSRAASAGAGGSLAGGGGAGTSGSAGTGAGGGMSEGVATPSCRTAADCPGGAPCLLQGTFIRPCRGITCEADIEPPCTTSADCAAPEVCHVLVSQRCGADLYRGCGAPCTSDGDCPDERCGDGGQCRPRSHCSFGAVCPTQTRCEEGPESDFVGCTRNTCTTDEDCAGSGYCIDDRCYNQLGSCQTGAQSCTAP
jgi:hypothetical protein